MSGLASFISGAPTSVGFTLADGADLTGGGEGQRIVQLKSAVLPRSERAFYRFFDTSVFARPALGTLGSAPRTSFRGLGMNDGGLSVKRMFRIKERAAIEFRMDSYNFFNHTQFSGVAATARFEASGVQINQELGQITSARPPRRMQASLRFSF